MKPGALAPSYSLPLDSPGIIALVSPFALDKVDQVELPPRDCLGRRSTRTVGRGTRSLKGNRDGENRVTTRWRVPRELT